MNGKRNILLVLSLFEILLILLSVIKVLALTTSIVIAIILIIIAVYTLLKKEVKLDDEIDQDYIIDINDIREMKNCPVCQTKNIINRKYCTKCGSNIQNIICPVCEEKNPFDSKYCCNCDSILQNTNRH